MPTKLSVLKFQILTALYSVYSAQGYGPQSTSPQLGAIAPDGVKQALLAEMMPDYVAKAQIQNPASPPNQAAMVDVYHLTIRGIRLYEGVPDPTNPPLGV